MSTAWGSSFFVFALPLPKTAGSQYHAQFQSARKTKGSAKEAEAVLDQGTATPMNVDRIPSKEYNSEPGGKGFHHKREREGKGFGNMARGEAHQAYEEDPDHGHENEEDLE
ncbi:hypothetical protein K438DRAFT_1935050 [Mycena galopus ATCC 62051]|nr:hypothetical protein K438DRAFT_1935050 [Mycena galopus ATCC 62051]